MNAPRMRPPGGPGGVAAGVRLTRGGGAGRARRRHVHVRRSVMRPTPSTSPSLCTACCWVCVGAHRWEKGVERERAPVGRNDDGGRAVRVDGCACVVRVPSSSAFVNCTIAVDLLSALLEGLHCCEPGVVRAHRGRALCKRAPEAPAYSLVLNLRETAMESKQLLPVAGGGGGAACLGEGGGEAGPAAAER